MNTQPTYRYLRGYALDPGFSTKLDTAGINEVVYRIPFEKLEPGPVGEYVEVIDFDPASKSWYEPVDLRKEEIASQQGLAPSEGMPQFHQQFVYCVAMKTIRHFEEALGRRIVWYPRWDRTEKSPPEYVQRLRIYPHALRDANAYYDATKWALLFGYFDAANQSLGANFPGGLVFTCLSPDIVAHETTHAILDAIHRRYKEDTNLDVAAFHEGFADIVALLQRFTFRKLVEDQLARTSGRLDGATVFGELATQFGEALEGNRGALRSAIGSWQEDDNGKRVWVPHDPTPADYAAATEPHDRGAVLVATIFDAFQRIYDFRTRDLFRIASNGTGRLPEGNISPDLVGRLAGEASEIAEHLLHICIRALDYCPPVDPSFGDYLRALITADVTIAPEDENGYRLALIEAFRARGILPPNVNTLSIESLQWSKPTFDPEETTVLEYVARTVRPFVTDMVATHDRREIFDLAQRAQATLHDLLESKGDMFDPKTWEEFLNKLGLTAKSLNDVFGKKKYKFKGDPNKPAKIEVHTVRPAFRAGREGRHVDQVLITVTQTVRIDLDGREIVFRGGSSLILSLGSMSYERERKREAHRAAQAASGTVAVTPTGAPVAEYVVTKRVTNVRRLEQQIAYEMGESDAPAQMHLYTEGRERKLNFRLLHRL
jgi:hypothetical protein